MKTIIKSLYFQHKSFWKRRNIISLFISFPILVFAFIVQKIADNYVIETKWIEVWDIILSNIPVFDIYGFIIVSTLCFTFIITLIVISKPKYILFTVKSLALFIIIRSFFISLTHLWIQPHEITFDSDTIWFSIYDIIYNTKNDYFFSWHTWLPFLFALIFYNQKILRNICFIISFIFGTSVILWHIHYSIDVFSAPFMTYSIYSISKILFKKDYNLTQK
jgi:hypothetical protein